MGPGAIAGATEDGGVTTGGGAMVRAGGGATGRAGGAGATAGLEAC